MKRKTKTVKIGRVFAQVFFSKISYTEILDLIFQSLDISGHVKSVAGRSARTQSLKKCLCPGACIFICVRSEISVNKKEREGISV